VATFDEHLPTSDGWAKVNRHHWIRDYADFATFFFSEITSEPHSTKAIEDAVEWALDGSVDAMLADADAPIHLDPVTVEAMCRSIRCPMLLVHGTEDSCQPPARAERLAELTGAPLVLVEGADHMIPARHPVLANLLIRDFVRSIGGPTP
jgi:pimeloyl-ACP methyl ester carboxylesterase